MKRRILAAFLICMVLAFLTACGGGEKEKAETKTTTGTSASTDETTQEAKNESDSEEKTAAEDVTQSNPGQPENGSIVVYFGRVGNTDFPDNIDASSSASIQADNGEIKGNAQMIAEWIAEEAGCDTSEILVTDSYPVDYDETVDQARDEQNEGTKPALKTDINVDGYDTVYLVFPNWWGDLPMPVYSFFDACDLSGKKINVFITHEGSGFSSTIDTIKELEPEAKVTEGIAVQGGSVTEEEENIRQWVSDNK